MSLVGVTISPFEIKDVGRGLYAVTWPDSQIHLERVTEGLLESYDGAHIFEVLYPHSTVSGTSPDDLIVTSLCQSWDFPVLKSSSYNDAADLYKSHFCNIKSCTICSQNNPINTTYVPVVPAAKNTSSIKKCECGSETCGSGAHSSWCPKYEA